MTDQDDDYKPDFREAAKRGIIDLSENDDWDEAEDISEPIPHRTQGKPYNNVPDNSFPTPYSEGARPWETNTGPQQGFRESTGLREVDQPPKEKGQEAEGEPEQKPQSTGLREKDESTGLREKDESTGLREGTEQAGLREKDESTGLREDADGVMPELEGPVKGSVVEDRNGQLSGMDSPDLAYRYMEKVGSAIAQAAAEMGGSMVSRGWDLASDIVRMTFTQPHAMSSTSRMIGTAMGSLELAGDFADRAAQKYGVNIQQDPELIKDTIKYKLYKREAQQANGVVGNTFRTISDSLGKMGVQDISQMTPDQLSQHVADMRQEASRLMGIIAKDKENLQLGKRQDRLSSQDRGLVYAQAKHLQSYLDQLSKQGATMAADQRMMARQQRQASRQQRLQAQSTLANGSANPYQQILQWADPNANWEIDGNTGMPTHTGAYNIMLRTLRDKRAQEIRANGKLTPERQKWYDDMDSKLMEHKNLVDNEARRAPLRPYGNVFVGISDYAPGIRSHLPRILKHGDWSSLQFTRNIRGYLAGIVGRGGSSPEYRHARALLLSLDLSTRTRALRTSIGTIDPRAMERARLFHDKEGDPYRGHPFDAVEAEYDEAELGKAYEKFNSRIPKDVNGAQRFDPEDPVFRQALNEYQTKMREYKDKWFPLRDKSKDDDPVDNEDIDTGKGTGGSPKKVKTGGKKRTATKVVPGAVPATPRTGRTRAAQFNKLFKNKSDARRFASKYLDGYERIKDEATYNHLRDVFASQGIDPQLFEDRFGGFKPLSMLPVEERVQVKMGYVTDRGNLTNKILRKMFRDHPGSAELMDKFIDGTLTDEENNRLYDIVVSMGLPVGRSSEPKTPVVETPLTETKETVEEEDEPEFLSDGRRNWKAMPLTTGDEAHDEEVAKKVYDALGEYPKSTLYQILQQVNKRSDKVKFSDVGQMLDAFSRFQSMDENDPLYDQDMYLETKDRAVDDPTYQASLAASRIGMVRPQLEKMGVWDNIVGTPAQPQTTDTPQTETEVPQTDKDTSQTDTGGTQVPETPVIETELDQKKEGTDEFVEGEEIEDPVKRIEMTPDQVKHKHNLSVEFGMDEDKIDEHLDSFLKNAGFSSGSRPSSGNSYKKILSAVKASHIYDEIRDKAIRTGREEALAQTIQKYIMEYNNLTQIFPSLKESASDIDKKTKDKLKNRVINFKKTTHDINIDKEIGNEESGVDPGKDLKFLKQFEDELFHAYPPSSGNKTSPEYDKFEKYIKDWTRNHKYVQGKSSYAKLIRDYVMSPEGLNGQWPSFSGRTHSEYIPAYDGLPKPESSYKSKSEFVNDVFKYVNHMVEVSKALGTEEDLSHVDELKKMNDILKDIFSEIEAGLDDPRIDDKSKAKLAQLGTDLSSKWGHILSNMVPNGDERFDAVYHKAHTINATSKDTTGGQISRDVSESAQQTLAEQEENRRKAKEEEQARLEEAKNRNYKTYEDYATNVEFLKGWIDSAKDPSELETISKEIQDTIEEATRNNTLEYTSQGAVITMLNNLLSNDLGQKKHAMEISQPFLNFSDDRTKWAQFIMDEKDEAKHGQLYDAYMDLLGTDPVMSQDPEKYQGILDAAADADTESEMARSVSIKQSIPESPEPETRNDEMERALSDQLKATVEHMWSDFDSDYDEDKFEQMLTLIKNNSALQFKEKDDLLQRADIFRKMANMAQDAPHGAVNQADYTHVKEKLMNMGDGEDVLKMLQTLENIKLKSDKHNPAADRDQRSQDSILREEYDTEDIENPSKDVSEEWTLDSMDYERAKQIYNNTFGEDEPDNGEEPEWDHLVDLIYDSADSFSTEFSIGEMINDLTELMELYDLDQREQDRLLRRVDSIPTMGENLRLYDARRSENGGPGKDVEPKSFRDIMRERNPDWE
jgi:hypothetical protein